MTGTIAQFEKEAESAEIPAYPRDIAHFPNEQRAQFFFDDVDQRGVGQFLKQFVRTLLIENIQQEDGEIGILLHEVFDHVRRESGQQTIRLSDFQQTDFMKYAGGVFEKIVFRSVIRVVCQAVFGGIHISAGRKLKKTKLHTQERNRSCILDGTNRSFAAEIFRVRGYSGMNRRPLARVKSISRRTEFG